MLFTRSKTIDSSRIYRIFKMENTFNYIAAARFTRDISKFSILTQKTYFLPQFLK